MFTNTAYLNNGSTSYPGATSLADGSLLRPSQVKTTVSPRLIDKAKEIGEVAIKVLLNAVLYYLTPSLFTAGLFAGIIFDEQATLTIQKIRSVWKSQPWRIFPVLALGALISLPVVLGAGAILCGAELGSNASGDEKSGMPPAAGNG